MLDSVKNPAYWGESNKKLYYSSDFKSLINLQNFKNLNESKIQEYFTYGYIAAPDTLIKNIKKLEAGSYLIFLIQLKLDLIIALLKI